MWNYNRKLRADPEFRARPFYVEAGVPDAVCVSFTHDRDYEAVVGRRCMAVVGGGMYDSK